MFVGDLAGQGLTTADRCVFIGNTSGAIGTVTGDKNTGVGDNSLRNVSSGASNTAVGSESLMENTTASNNTAFGKSALKLNTTGAAEYCCR